MSPTESVTGAIEEEVDHLTKDNVDSTDSDIRYLAYGARLRTALRASTRYIAYVRVFCLSNCSQ